MTSPAPSSRPRPDRAGTCPPAGITHKFSIAGFEGYLTANPYDDDSMGELFINDGRARRYWPAPLARGAPAGATVGPERSRGVSSNTCAAMPSGSD